MAPTNSFPYMGFFTALVMWTTYTSLATWVAENWFLFFIVSKQRNMHALGSYVKYFNLFSE